MSKHPRPARLSRRALFGGIGPVVSGLSAAVPLAAVPLAAVPLAAVPAATPLATIPAAVPLATIRLAAPAAGERAPGELATGLHRGPDGARRGVGGVAIPIQMVPTSNDGVVPVVTVSAGGGAPVKVILDTGSTGLVLEPGAIGPDARATGLVTKISYVGLTLTADVVSAPVRLLGSALGVRTGPIDVSSITTRTIPALFSASGTEGILGVAPGTNAMKLPDVLSPLVQLPLPLGDGFAITLSTRSGRLVLGEPALRHDPDSVELAMVKADGSYPTGLQAEKKSVSMCWRVASASTCALTSMDTGAFAGIVSSSLMPDAPSSNGRISTGTPVTIAAPLGELLCSFVAGSDAANPAPQFLTNPVMNTGRRFFYANTVAYDLVSGEVVITPRHRRQTSCSYPG